MQPVYELNIEKVYHAASRVFLKRLEAMTVRFYFFRCSVVYDTR